MTREWISKKDHRWVMVCDEPECSTRSEPFDRQPPLEEFAQRGWYIARLYGDQCPDCRAKAPVQNWKTQAPPHPLMTA